MKMHTRSAINHHFHYFFLMFTHVMFSVVHESIEQSNHFRTQPQVLEYLHETSEAYFVSGADTGCIINETAQQVVKESFVNGTNQFNDDSRLRDLLGQPSSRQFSGDEDEEEEQEAEDGDETEDEGRKCSLLIASAK